MKYASVFDGIGAAHVAWQPLGWHCEWTADGPRYKALGNSMAVPVMRWIGERIAKGVCHES